MIENKIFECVVEELSICDIVRVRQEKTIILRYPKKCASTKILIWKYVLYVHSKIIFSIKFLNNTHKYDVFGIVKKLSGKMN
ncbi:hypothetical protein BpHYR1_022238 [Brachionus plicatilis]|uniref:Uncharacterized protein n=1 Tax=Brachionus plicatilis TaxID=10195 RepID=A0A3M7T5C3_BRAPC|nr:hypothetical protein BpHYR1_022238 [Brachionus plicatilis]